MEPLPPATGPPAEPLPAAPPDPAGPPGPPPRPAEPPRATGLLVLLLAVLPLSFIGAVSLLAGALVTQVALVLVTLGWARRSGLLAGPLLRLRAPPRGALRLGAGIGLASMLAGSGLHALTRSALPDRLVQLFDVGRALLDAGWSQAVLIGVVSLLPAVCEELSFRGGLLSALASRGSPARAIGLSALFFAAFHLDPVRFPAVLLLGTAFGWLAWRTGSIWPSMVAHAVNNGAAVVGLLLAGRAGQSEPAEQLPWTESVVLLAAGALLFALLAEVARRWLQPPPDAASYLVRSAPTTRGAAPSP